MPCQQSETTLSSGKLFLAITSQAAEAFLSGQPPLPAEQLFFVPLLRPEIVQASESNLNLLGPIPGYAPQVGSFVSELTWMREAE
jgi:hypothetical protein